MREIIYFFVCFFAFLFERGFINFKKEVFTCGLEEEEGSDGAEVFVEGSEGSEGSEESEEYIEEEGCVNNKKEEIL